MRLPFFKGRKHKKDLGNGDPTDAPTLEEVLLALQKSFSRLSARTAEGGRAQPERARALIVGDVTFEIALHVEPVDERGKSPNPTGPRFDKLRYRPEGGGIALRLRGALSPDVRWKGRRTRFQARHRREELPMPDEAIEAPGVRLGDLFRQYLDEVRGALAGRGEDLVVDLELVFKSNPYRGAVSVMEETF